MGHALINKLLTGRSSDIWIFTKECTGTAGITQSGSPWKDLAIFLAGPMANIAFASSKLIAAAALRRYFLGIATLILGGGGSLWMAGELFYAFTSATQRNDGDFGKIAKQGNGYLALASLLLVLQCALGVFSAIYLTEH
ncbi:MAG: hypothetical protein KGI80_05940 [Verrucomicrobiota bacterium]|nr:hypothetical protein [Verrucomicrobiota bacterium]